AAQPPPELTTRERELLTLLSAGNTDESAAAQLGVSVRTVRRMVADIMDRLGARSRFQAGVKAADRGWLLNRTGLPPFRPRHPAGAGRSEEHTYELQSREKLHCRLLLDKK